MPFVGAKLDGSLSVKLARDRSAPDADLLAEVPLPRAARIISRRRRRDPRRCWMSYGSMMPRRTAIATDSVRSLAWSFRMMC